VAGLGKPGKSYIFLLIAVLVLITILPGRIPGQARPAREAQQRIEGISENERAVLQNLFVLTQEIEEMDREQENTINEIEILRIETKAVGEKIEIQQRDYDSKLDVLKQVLVSYQRRGPASYLRIILGSDNLTSFLRSINTVKDLTRNTGDLLDSLEQEKGVLIAEREGLAEGIALLEAKRGALEEAVAKKRQLREEQEAYLNSLQEEAVHYRELLANLQDKWDQIKVLFSDIVKEFDRIIGEGKYPMEDLDLKFGLLNVKGTIREDTLNAVYKDNSNLTEIVFHFYPGRAEIEIPDKQLALRGTFSVEGGRALKFTAEEGSFYGMDLEKASIEELFRDGHLSIDFGAFVDVTIQSVKVCDGYLEFTVKSLF
jgi:peptidoglycan hydrolase CwlO-like protein